MKKTFVKAAMSVSLCLAVLAGGVAAGAAYTGSNDKSPGDNRTPFTEETRRNDGRMVIREAGEYTLTGDMRGMVFVDPGKGDVRLILDGARLDGAQGPAIAAVSGDRLTIELPEGSMNSIAGGPGSDFGAAVYSEVPLFFEGNGRLDMASEGQDAIRVRDNDLTFNGGDFRIQANENGFNAPNVNFNGGMVSLDAERNDFAPGADMNQNGGQLQQNWAPAADFMQGSRQSGRFNGNQQAGQTPTAPNGNQHSAQQPAMPGGSQSNQQGNPFGGMQNGAAQSSADSPTAVVTGTTENSAMSLTADYDNAATYTVTNEDGTVKISDSGTYIVTGASDDGSITVKKGTTGVVLVLENLDLTSTSGAALSINKNAEVQVVVSGDVTLTDGENPADEYSTDEAVADAYDGAAIKVKAGSVAFITGDGTLTVNGNAKNGIKGGDDSSIIIGGDVTVNINAVNDGVNGNYDVTVLSGDVTISAGDDGIHADHILTVGSNGTGPNLTVTSSSEGLEGTVVNIAGGKVNVTAKDDGINAANGDGVYEGELDYSVNITGGSVTVNAGTDGIDSNGSVNLIGGSATIRSASNGGDAGIDYDGELYISDDFQLNNFSGVAGPDNMGGMPGGMGGFGGRTAGGPSFGGGMGGGFQPAGR